MFGFFSLLKRAAGRNKTINMKTIMKLLLTTALCFVACALTVFAQTGKPEINSDPNKAKFVSSDINNFLARLRFGGEAKRQGKENRRFSSRISRQRQRGTSGFSPNANQKREG